MEKRKYGFGAYASTDDVFKILPRRIDKDEAFEANLSISPKHAEEYIKFQLKKRV